MDETSAIPSARCSISSRLTRKLLITLVLLAVAAGLAVYWQARTALQTQFDAALRVRAEALGGLLERKGGHIELDLSDKNLREDPGTSFLFEARASNGETVDGSPSVGQAIPPSLYNADDSPVFQNLALPDGRPGRAVGMKFQVRDEDDSSTAVPLEVVVVVASSREPLLRTLRTLQFVLVTGGVVLLIATFVAVPRILRRELRPLRQIAAQASAIDSSSLSARFPSADAPDEIAAITTRLNDLLTRLEDSFARERRFSSDVAHEFRTPIAELRTFAELALKLPHDRPANTDQEVLNITLHMERMLTELLMLARGEQNEWTIVSEPIDVAALASDICREFQTKAEQRHLSLDLRLAPGQRIISDPALLRSILTNLVDNALEYAPAGATVIAEVARRNGRISVEITNPAHDLTEQDLPRLFDRFWRKDPARGINGHTGLGLALARTFARKLDSDLTAAFSAPGRLTLALALKPETETAGEKTTTRSVGL